MLRLSSKIKFFKQILKKSWLSNINKYSEYELKAALKKLSSSSNQQVLSLSSNLSFYQTASTKKTCFLIVRYLFKTDKKTGFKN